MRSIIGALVIGVASLAAIGIAVAQDRKAAPAGLSLELNKLEDREGSCRAYLVFDNRTLAGFDSFKLDLVLFGTDGVIIRRMAVEAAPLRPEKKAVKLFDIAGTACAAIGSVLVNDVMSCQGGQGEQPDCIGQLTVASRVSATLMK
jgi:hypothetical protein